MKTLYIKSSLWIMGFALGIGGASVLLARTYCYYLNATGEIVRTDDCNGNVHMSNIIPKNVTKALVTLPLDTTGTQLPLLKHEGFVDNVGYSCLYGEFDNDKVVLCKQVPADKTRNAVISFLCAQTCDPRENRPCHFIGKLPDGRLCYHKK